MPEDSPPLALLHEDPDIVAVAKPSGQAVIAARGESRSLCLQKQLESRLHRRLWVVHRIDRDASGVVLFALNADAHRELSLAFEHRQVVKTYAAFVAGSIEPSRGLIEVPLHPARKDKTRPALPGEPGALPSSTGYATRKRWLLPVILRSSVPAERRRIRNPGGSFGTGQTEVPQDDRTAVSLLEVHPLTGRHHQIRVHLRSAGAPILSDPLYGRGLMPEGLAGAPCARLALHARRIDVPAPRGGGRLVVEAPLADDLVALAEWLDGCSEKDESGV
ncbi:MAG TPA: RluA family pseudouridine synthase [Vicinamibacteria bacterium]|nr:RluA family pseudouridine synthase [Vicinamibacteria bacterium]